MEVVYVYCCADVQILGQGMDVLFFSLAWRPNNTVGIMNILLIQCDIDFPFFMFCKTMKIIYIS